MVAEASTAGREKLFRYKKKTIRQLPQFFRSGKDANVMRAMRLWKERDDRLARGLSSGTRGDMLTSVGHITKNGKKRLRTKARAGRGRQCSGWVKDL